jgi:hypothetical protein
MPPRGRGPRFCLREAATLHNPGRKAGVMLYAALLAALHPAARAFTITLSPAAPATIFLQVGVGSYTGTYCGANCSYNPPIAPNGTPGTNTTINTASVTVAAAAVGNGTAQAMTTNSTQSLSFFDDYAFCNTPAQLYIGGFYRSTTSGNGSVSVTATVPAALTSASGALLSFAQISWTSAGNADTGAEPFPAGTFSAGGVQTVGTIAQNQWAESCWTFSYANGTVPPAGTYTGQVLFTAVAP